MNTVASLRQSGCKVRVSHFRLVKANNTTDLMATNLMSMREIKENNLQNFILPKGGLTKVEITDLNNKNYEVTAKCNPIDSYNRKIAVKICLGRIEKQMT